MHLHSLRVSVLFHVPAATQRPGQRPATSAAASPCSMLLRPERPEHSRHCAVLLLWAHYRLLPAGTTAMHMLQKLVKLPHHLHASSGHKILDSGMRAARS